MLEISQIDPDVPHGKGIAVEASAGRDADALGVKQHPYLVFIRQRNIYLAIAVHRLIARQRGN